MHPTDLSWQDKAACKGQDREMFFPHGMQRRDALPAIRICSECPVQRICLDYAIAHDEYGVWGGTTAYERRLIRRARARQLA